MEQSSRSMYDEFNIFFLHLYVFQCINESVKAHTTFRLCCLFKEAFNELENFKYATRHEDYWFIFRQCFVHILPADGKTVHGCMRSRIQPIRPYSQRVCKLTKWPLQKHKNKHRKQIKLFLMHEYANVSKHYALLGFSPAFFMHYISPKSH